MNFSVPDNMQRILNCRAGTLVHLTDARYDQILQGMPDIAHELMTTLSGILQCYESRLNNIKVDMLPQTIPGECAMPLMPG